jgi:hypothetical protein
MENKKESINDPTLKLCDIDFSKIPKPDDFRNVKVNSNIK